MKIKIVSDGTGKGTLITDEGGKEFEGCYAFEISGRRSQADTRATVFCFGGQLEFEGEAEVVKVPVGLKSRAQIICDKLDSPVVREAFKQLFGFPMAMLVVENVTNYQSGQFAEHAAAEI